MVLNDDSYHNTWFNSKALELAGITIRALEGDFSGAHFVMVNYVPAPVLGIPQLPVPLGQATALTGFGTEVVLDAADVDLLELIRANDESLSGECPSIQVVVIATAVPTEPIRYMIELEIDAYAAFGVGSLWAIT